MSVKVTPEQYAAMVAREAGAPPPRSVSKHLADAAYHALYRCRTMGKVADLAEAMRAIGETEMGNLTAGEARLFHRATQDLGNILDGYLRGEK